MSEEIQSLYKPSHSSSSSEEEDIQSLMVFSSATELNDCIREELRFTPSEARLAIESFGAGRCERCLVKTIHDVKGGGIRTPPGWFLSTLSKGKEPTVEDMREEPLASMVEELRQRRDGASGDTEKDWLESRYRQGKSEAGSDA